MEVYRCAIIKSLDKQSVLQIGQLYEYGESGADGPLLPVLLLVDQVDDQQFQLFCEALAKAPSSVKAVILRCRPILFDFQKEYSMTSQGESPPVKLPSRLSKKESDQVKLILKKLGNQHDQKGEDEKQILYLGLKLFGNEFNPELLARFVRSHLDRASNIERDMLLFCSLLYKYMHKAIPVGFTQSLISPLERFIPNLSRAEISDRTADLLLVIRDSFAAHQYSGYRPAHYRVGLQVLDNCPLVIAAGRFLDKMLAGTFSHASKILMELTVQLFLRRDITSDFDVDDENVSGDLDTLEEPPKGEKKQRFSPLIMELLSGDAKDDALRLLIDLCKKTVATSSEAFVWQHSARFLAFEFAEMELPALLNVAFCGLLGKDENLHPRSGYDAAVAAIDRAIELIRDRSSFHTTRGLVYKLQLTPYKSRLCSADELIRAVRLTQIACMAFHKAREYDTFSNWHPLIGEIEVCLDLLRLVKDLIYKDVIYKDSGRDSSFRSFLDNKSCPGLMKDWDAEDLSFVRLSEQRIADNLDEIFEREHFTKSETRLHSRGRHLAQLRGSRLRADFIKVCEIARIANPTVQPDQIDLELEHRRRLADLVLQDRGETPFSAWDAFALLQDDLMKIAELLGPCVVNGRPAVHADATLVMIVRACIELRENSPLSSSEIVSLVNSWCSTNPSSKWAHFFQYIFYFPLPSPICLPDKDVVRSAVGRCRNIIEEHLKLRHPPRRSRAMYFACQNGSGLNVLIPPHQFSRRFADRNEFWRHSKTRAILLRMKGEKVKYGTILCEGIEIKFDNDLYPNESQDTLYFYLGFTTQGPYAYDPVSESTLEDLIQRNTDLSVDSDSEAADDLPRAPSAPPKLQKASRGRGGAKAGNGKSAVTKGPIGHQDFIKGFPTAGTVSGTPLVQASANPQIETRTKLIPFRQEKGAPFPRFSMAVAPTTPGPIVDLQRSRVNQFGQPAHGTIYSEASTSCIRNSQSRSSESSSPVTLTRTNPGETADLQRSRVFQLGQPAQRPIYGEASATAIHHSPSHSLESPNTTLQEEAFAMTRKTLSTMRQRTTNRPPSVSATAAIPWPSTGRENSSAAIQSPKLHTGRRTVSFATQVNRPTPTWPPVAVSHPLECHFVDPIAQQVHLQLSFYRHA